jgi:hypothetical protein
MKVFTKLSKPEKMAWMFDYHIQWDAPAAQVSAQLQTDARLRVDPAAA